MKITVTLTLDVPSDYEPGAVGQAVEIVRHCIDEQIGSLTKRATDMGRIPSCLLHWDAIDHMHSMAARLRAARDTIEAKACEPEQSGLEAKYEKARQAWDDMRESILHQRDHIADYEIDCDIINGVLSNIDEYDPFDPI